ncbi:MAG: hypothetical protein NWQ63_02655 [Schleiferiaceae bacterium]|jgi:hypothetical protein|nr:hypothetical protein [Schleiferiaceae bacterium]MDP4766892.1 hypothetical protein [Schleiferiaceae bacterium]MDP4877822.1 hypothetical protein [Schleiferiaceae bacterium]MDP4958893.1 hypothetical protein [Schleiferiaceae bacterium]
MDTKVSQPIYQEALAINRNIQSLTKGYHSNGTFNLAFKIKDDIINVCNLLDMGVSARFEHTFEGYYKEAKEQINLLLEHIRIANSTHMIRGGFPEELVARIKLLRMRITLLLELFRTTVPLDYLTLSTWARQKLTIT